MVSPLDYEHALGEDVGVHHPVAPTLVDDLFAEFARSTSNQEDRA